jgi:hypothetical protein
MVDNEEALQILAEGGARVDFNDKVTFIPPPMVDGTQSLRPIRAAVIRRRFDDFWQRAHYSPKS